MALTVSVQELVAQSKSPLLAAPLHWKRVRLGDIAQVLNGFAFKSSQFSRDEGMPLIRIRDVGGDGTDTRYVGAYDERYVVRAGDLLIGMDGDFNCARWRGDPGLLNQRVCKVAVDSSAYEPRLLDYVLPAYLKAINDATSSVTVKHLSSRSIEDIPLPLPPRGEQGRIVAEIEKQFSRLDEAVANLERVKVNLRRFTASVYQAGADGSLVEASAGQRDLAESGQALLERIRQLHRTSWRGRGGYRVPADAPSSEAPALPDGWVWTTWGQVGHSQNGRPFPSKEYQDHGVKLLRPGNMHESGALVWSDANTRCLPSEYLDENKDLLVGGGELVMNLTAQSLKDEFLGRVCLTQEGERCLLNQRLARLTPCGVSPSFAFIVFKSRWFRTFVDGLNTGSLIQHMFTSQLESFPFPLAPSEVQNRIVAEVDRRLSIVRGVEAEVDANLKRAQALRQAILAKAFGGITEPQTEAQPA